MSYIGRIGISTAELTTRSIESASKIGVIAGETAVVGAETVKVGAEIVEVGAKTARSGVEVAEEVAKAVKDRAGNITKVGLETSKKTLEIASATTGAVSALSSSIESKTQRLRNSIIRTTNIEKQAGNNAKNKLISIKSQKIKRNANLQNMKNSIKYKEELQKLLDKDKILMKKSFDTTLLNLVELKDIVCNKKSSITFYKSKCIYIIKNFDLKKYQTKINIFIDGYQKCYKKLINEFELKLKIYIDNKNNNNKKKFDQSKLDIASSTYEISIFLQLINYSIIQIFSHINTKIQNITNNQNKELDKIYNMIDNDIKKRLSKNLKQNNSLAQIISYQVKNNVTRINNGLNNNVLNNNVLNNNTGLRLNNGLNNFEKLSNKNKEELMSKLNGKNIKGTILSNIAQIINNNNNSKTTKNQQSSKEYSLEGLTNENRNELMKILEIENIQGIISNNKATKIETFERIYKNPKIKEILNKNPKIKGYNQKIITKPNNPS